MRPNSPSSHGDPSAPDGEATQRDPAVTVDWFPDRVCVVTYRSGRTETISDVSVEGADWLRGLLTERSRDDITPAE
jgi:hypothetical protein